MILTISTQAFTSKPGKGDYPKLKSSSGNTTKDVSISELAAYISNGHSFHSAIFDNSQKTLSKETFQKIECIGLDFDSKEADKSISFNDMKEKLLKMNLKPIIMYPTFSDTSDQEGGVHKFRVLFRLPETITTANRRKFSILIDMLHTLFPQCDQACVDISRMFHGTNKPLDRFYVDEDAVLDETILWSYYFEHVETSISDSSQKAKVWKSTASAWGGKLRSETEALPHIEENSPLIYPDFIEEYAGADIKYTKPRKRKAGTGITDAAQPKKKNTISPNSPNYPNAGIKRIPPKEIPNWDDTLEKSCQLYKEFKSGARILRYPDRLFLITNLCRISGGKKKYLAIMQSNIDLYEHPFEHYKVQCDAISRQLQHAQSCLKYKYFDYAFDDTITRMGYYSLFDALQKIGGPPERIKTTPRITVDEAFEKTASSFNSALHSEDNDIHIIRAGVGIGKTKLYTQESYSAYNRVIIALPTHALAVQVYEDFKQNEIRDCIYIPERPPLPNSEQNNKYYALMRIGLVKEAKKYYKACCEEVGEFPDGYSKFVDATRNAQDAHIIITTHQNLSNMSADDVDLVIIDEDLRKTYLSSHSCQYEALRAFYTDCIIDAKKVKYVPLVEEIDIAFQDFWSKCDSEYFESAPIPLTSHVIFSEADIMTEKVTSSMENAALFASSSGFCIDKNNQISFINHSPYQFSCKSIVLSATVDETTSKYIFAGRQIHWYSIPLVRNVEEGQVIHDITFSCSRYMLEKGFKDLVSYIKMSVPNWNECTLITFKSFVPLFEAEGFKIYYIDGDREKPMAFGRTEGINDLTGQPIIVVGKFSYSKNMLKLYAMALGIDYEEDNMVNRKQEIGDYIVPVVSFASTELWQLQLSITQSETIQAVGRSRTVRTPAKVWIFNNIPCPVADEVRYNGLTISEVNEVQQEEVVLMLPQGTTTSEK